MMTTVEPIVYKYGLSVKLNKLGAETGLSAIAPGLEDLIISSRKFDKFEDAVKSANKLVSGITASLNVAVDKPQFKLISEINPKHSGNPTVSKDWGLNEVAKLWIIDELQPKTKEGNISAIGLAQLLEVPGEPAPLS